MLASIVIREVKHGVSKLMGVPTTPKWVSYVSQSTKSPFVSLTVEIIIVAIKSQTHDIQYLPNTTYIQIEYT